MKAKQSSKRDTEEKEFCNSRRKKEELSKLSKSSSGDFGEKKM